MPKASARNPSMNSRCGLARHSLLDRMEDEEFLETDDHDGPSSSKDQSQSPQENDEMIPPRLWEDVYMPLIVLCLFSVFGVLLICLPLLPKKHHTSEGTVQIVRTALIASFLFFALVAIFYLLRCRDRLHYSGMILWPHRCQKCHQLLKDLNSYMEGSSTSKGQGNSGTGHSLPVNKSPLYL